ESLPAVALVARAENMVASGIERIWIMRREHDGERPLETILHLVRRRAANALGPDANVAYLAGAVVVACQVALIAAGVDEVGVVWAHGDVAALATANLVPVRTSDGVMQRAARHGNGCVVLLRAVNPIRELVVGDDVIELACRLVVNRAPSLAAVERD